MVTRTLWFIGCLVTACFLVVLLSAVGHLIFNPGGDGSSSIGQTVRSHIEGTLTDLPPGFEETVNRDGSEGSCSVPAAYPGFAGACRTHDLGYDLLRYASKRGEPLGPWARLDIDRRFHQDMLATCDGLGCRLLAHLYGFGVALNSVRQGFTAPTVEPIAPWVGAGMLAVTVAAGISTSYPPAEPRRKVERPIPTTSHA